MNLDPADQVKLDELIKALLDEQSERIDRATGRFVANWAGNLERPAFDAGWRDLTDSGNEVDAFLRNAFERHRGKIETPKTSPPMSELLNGFLRIRGGDAESMYPVEMTQTQFIREIKARRSHFESIARDHAE